MEPRLSLVNSYFYDTNVYDWLFRRQRGLNVEVESETIEAIFPRVFARWSGSIQGPSQAPWTLDPSMALQWLMSPNNDELSGFRRCLVTSYQEE
jgi:hypothetical protein